MGVLKYIDIVSPKITFYYNGSLIHSSIFSGIISILAVLLIIGFSSPFLSDFIHNTNFNAFYYISFIEDAPTLMINSTSLFHYLNFAINGRTKVYAGIDFTVFNIIGISRAYQGQYDIRQISHWLYGICSDTDAEGINHLISYDSFTKAACIKKYFDHYAQKYYDKGHPNFKYPSISHGSFNDKNTIYNIYTLKCQDGLIGNILEEGSKCKTTEEMNQYFDNLGQTKVFEFYFLNNYVNISSYKNPVHNFFYRIESPFYLSHYTSNYININPSKVITDDGIIFNSDREEETYMYERNDAYVIDKENDNLYAIYGFVLKNIMNIYERNYSKFHEIIADIGGVFEILLVIASFINSLYNDYVALSDTSELLNSLIDKEKNPLKNENDNNKKEIKIELNNRSLADNKEEKYEANEIKNDEILKMKPVRLPPQFSKNSEKNSIKYSNNNSEMFTNDNMNNDGKKIEYSSTKNTEEIIENKIINENTLEKNKKSNFFGYVFYLITCKKKNSFYNIYNDFREKILSEEHLVRNHLNIYSLLRISKQSKSMRRNSYKINDLMYSL